MTLKTYPCYLARNKNVAIVYGLNAGLCQIERRMKSRKDCPAWLLAALEDMIRKSNDLKRPLELYRDQLPQFTGEKHENH